MIRPGRRRGSRAAQWLTSTACLPVSAVMKCRQLSWGTAVPNELENGRHRGARGSRIGIIRASRGSLFPLRVLHGTHEQTTFRGNREEILSMLQRRPCSVDDIARGLRMHPNEVVKYVEALAAEGLLETTWTAGKCYCKAAARGAGIKEGQPGAGQERETQ